LTAVLQLSHGQGFQVKVDKLHDMGLSTMTSQCALHTTTSTSNGVQIGAVIAHYAPDWVSRQYQKALLKQWYSTMVRSFWGDNTKKLQKPSTIPHTKETRGLSRSLPKFPSWIQAVPKKTEEYSPKFFCGFNINQSAFVKNEQLPWWCARGPPC
jgi:hypothetical protein